MREKSKRLALFLTRADAAEPTIYALKCYIFVLNCAKLHVGCSITIQYISEMLTKPWLGFVTIALLTHIGHCSSVHVQQGWTMKDVFLCQLTLKRALADPLQPHYDINTQTSCFQSATRSQRGSRHHNPLITLPLENIIWRMKTKLWSAVGMADVVSNFAHIQNSATRWHWPASQPNSFNCTLHCDYT